LLLLLLWLYEIFVFYPPFFYTEIDIAKIWYITNVAEVTLVVYAVCSYVQKHFKKVTFRN